MTQADQIYDQSYFRGKLKKAQKFNFSPELLQQLILLSSNTNTLPFSFVSVLKTEAFFSLQKNKYFPTAMSIYFLARPLAISHGLLNVHTTLAGLSTVC